MRPRRAIRYEITPKAVGGTSMFKDEIIAAQFCILVDETVVFRGQYDLNCKLTIETFGPIQLEEHEQLRFLQAYKRALRRAKNALTAVA